MIPVLQALLTNVTRITLLTSITTYQHHWNYLTYQHYRDYLIPTSITTYQHYYTGNTLPGISYQHYRDYLIPTSITGITLLTMHACSITRTTLLTRITLEDHRSES